MSNSKSKIPGSPPQSKIENQKSKTLPRGAPPGNLNALKHGFYSEQLKQADLDDLAQLEGDFDLQDEAGLLRIYIRRMVELSGTPQTAQEAAGLVRTVCLASLTLNRLLKTRAVLHIVSRQDRAAIARSLSNFDVALAKLMTAYHDGHDDDEEEEDLADPLRDDA